jgi:hypothetical protein
LILLSVGERAAGSGQGEYFTRLRRRRSNGVAALGFCFLLNNLPLLFLFLFLNAWIACSWPHLPCKILHHVQFVHITFFPPIYRAQFGSEFGKFEPEQIRMGERLLQVFVHRIFFLFPSQISGCSLLLR